MAEAEQERHTTATCQFLKRTYGVEPNITWGTLDDSLLRKWWDSNGCNTRVGAAHVHFAPLPESRHQHPEFLRQASVAEKQRDLVNTVYFTSYGGSALTADFSGINRVCYAFLSINAAGELTGGDSVNAQQLLAAKLRFPIRVLASIGGWGNCSNFSAVFASDKTRAACVASARQLLFKGWDGIDLDWEFPSGPEDPQNMLKFLRELREAFPKTLLTIAASTNIDYYKPLAAEFSAVLDTIYLMTYDYCGPWTLVSGHNSSVADSLASVQRFIDGGFPAGKLAIGSAWYARMCQVMGTGNNGLGQGCLSGEWKELTYAEVVSDYIGKRGFTRYWDSAKESAWLFNAMARTFISYEDETMVRVKRTQAKLKGLQGIFCWAYSQDSKGILKRALVGGI